MTGPSRLERVFLGVLRLRWPVVLSFALAAVPALRLARSVEHEPAIDRLIVADDPEAETARAFQEVFPQHETVVLLVVADDPFDPALLEQVAGFERDLAAVPGLEPFSALSVYRRVDPGFPASGPVPAEAARRFGEFAAKNTLLRRQGLAGDGFLGMPVVLPDAGDRKAADTALDAITELSARFEAGQGPARRVARIGGPFVDEWLERETTRSSARSFPLFGVFLTVLVLGLYRSVRTLAAFLLAIAASVLLTLSFAGLAGFPFTIVSSLVPLTILVSATATLVYLHSRFAGLPPGETLDLRIARAHANKFMPCTASLFAAAVGFAALAVSRIRPIHDLGLWVAAGLALTWLTVFTLFPALQSLLRTPSTGWGSSGDPGSHPILSALPLWSYRRRWLLVPGSLVLTAAGAAAVFGVPGLLAPMRLETDALDYIDRSLPLYQDTRRFGEAIGGLTALHVWVQAPNGGVLEPGLLRGLEAFTVSAEADPRIGSVTGPTAPLRLSSFLASGSERLPEDAATWNRLSGELEELILREPALSGFVDTRTLSSAQLTVITRASGWEELRDLREDLQALWAAAGRTHPQLAGARIAVTGQGLLTTMISAELVPTLVESFVLTAGVIFVAFLLLFRSGAARLMAMIPSVFAILVTFLLMRILSIPLNVATILIASTVLGASENDQIHFFWHYQERRGSAGMARASVEAALRHTLAIAGVAIFCATMINAGGFLALVFSNLPPMRQFGFISATAFLLSMIADFTVLPAALWMIFRAKPDAPHQG